MTLDEKKVEWWDNEGGFFGDYYREADDSFEGPLEFPLGLEERTKSEVEGIIKLSGIRERSKILDCPCGYGRHSLELARRGHIVVGVDINKNFLGIAEKERKKFHFSNCRFVEKDMRFLDFREEFDLVINMFYSFGFFKTEEENKKVAKNFFDALKVGGEFLMHTHVTVPRLVSGRLKNEQIRRLRSGNQLKLFRKYNEKNKREEGVWIILDKNGRQIKLTPYSVRIYTADEFSDLCKSVGFRKVEIFGSWKGERYRDNSVEMIVIAKK